jgi:hypothetical protein
MLGSIESDDITPMPPNERVGRNDAVECEEGFYDDSKTDS